MRRGVLRLRDEAHSRGVNGCHYRAVKALSSFTTSSSMGRVNETTSPGEESRVVVVVVVVKVDANRTATNRGGGERHVAMPVAYGCTQLWRTCTVE